MLSTGRNCSPAAPATVTPTSPTSTAVTSPFHHSSFRPIPPSSQKVGSRLGPIGAFCVLLAAHLPASGEKLRVDVLFVAVIVYPATRSRRWGRETAARL